MAEMDRLDYVTTDELIEELAARVENFVLIIEPRDVETRENDQEGSLVLHTMGNQVSDLAVSIGLLEVSRVRLEGLVRERWT